MSINYLDIDLMEKMCHRLAVAVFDTEDDPISPFKEHTKSLLDSALNLPRATFSEKELYPTLIDKASILYYTLIKNHPFTNGNKRIATVSLLTFLFINNQWLDTGINEMVGKAIYIAETKPQEKEDVFEKALENIKSWIAEHIIKIE